MVDQTFLQWPFFEASHRELAQDIDAWAASHIPELTVGEHEDLDGTCRALVQGLGNAGSDVASLATTAKEEGNEFVLNGVKTWISNGGIADFYTVFARTEDVPGARGLSCFIVDADTLGFEVTERIDLIAPHPLATLRFDNCRISHDSLVGERGQGFKIADMAVDVDASALLVYRSAWTKDCAAERVTREASMAKLYATEAAQRVIDDAVQLHGGHGVRRIPLS